QSRRGAALKRLNRLEEAESCYHQSIARDESLLGRFPDPVPIRLKLAATREALARLLLELRRRDEALASLDPAPADVRSIAPTAPGLGPAGGPRGERLASLADALASAGEAGRAQELAAWAAKLRTRPPRGPSGPPRPRPSPPPGDRGDGRPSPPPG